MRVLNDFTCTSCGDTEERFVEASTTELVCQACGGTATRRIRPVRCTLDPISGHFPGATDKWLKMREGRMKEEKKALALHGSEYLS